MSDKITLTISRSRSLWFLDSPDLPGLHLVERSLLEVFGGLRDVTEMMARANFESSLKPRGAWPLVIAEIEAPVPETG